MKDTECSIRDEHFSRIYLTLIGHAPIMLQATSHERLASTSRTTFTLKVVWSWWRHQMETCSALLALCEGNPPLAGRFPSQCPVSFDASFDVRLNKRLDKQSRRNGDYIFQCASFQLELTLQYITLHTLNATNELIVTKWRHLVSKLALFW